MPQFGNFQIQKPICLFNIPVDFITDEVQPGNAHVCGLSRHEALVGSGESVDPDPVIPTVSAN
jgi:hypothetical protein